MNSPRCPSHPEQGASACDRCGDFACALCRRSCGRRAICPLCATLPEVNYLEDFRARHWGRQDDYQGLLGGLGSIASVFALAALIMTTSARLDQGLDPLIPLLPSAYVLLLLITQVAYLLSKRWSRKGLIQVSAGGLLLSLIAALLWNTAFVLGIVTLTPILVIAVIAWFDPRNMLAFKLAIDDERLEDLYPEYADNPPLRMGLTLGLLSFFLPPVGLMGMVFSLKALAGCNLEGWPPVGGRRRAMAGIILNIVLPITGTWLWLRAYLQ